MEEEEKKYTEKVLGELLEETIQWEDEINSLENEIKKM